MIVFSINESLIHCFYFLSLINSNFHICTHVYVSLYIFVFFLFLCIKFGVHVFTLSQHLLVPKDIACAPPLLHSFIQIIFYQDSY